MLSDGRLAGPHQQADPQPQEPALVPASQGAALPLGPPPLCLLPRSQTLLRFSPPGLSLRTVTLRAQCCFSLLNSESMFRCGKACIFQHTYVHAWRSDMCACMEFVGMRAVHDARHEGMKQLSATRLGRQQ